MLENEKCVLKKFSMLNFGKHKGFKVSEVLEFEPGYFLWLKDNLCDAVEVSDDVLFEAEREVEYRKQLSQKLSI